ncbi:MAG: MBL fold metallo-hydrolase, partial [bacterium]
DLEYHKIYTLPGGIKIKLNDAGHILGSSIFEIWITENKAQKPQKLVFSGDLGNSPAPIMHDPEFIEGADYVFMESTYGGRIHESSLMRRTTLTNVIKDAINNNGTLVIPSFALERTQELLYELNQIVEEHQLPYVPIYLDSPLAIKAISVYRKYSRLFDEESQLLLKKGDDLFDFAGLEYVKNFEQSRALDNSRESKVIIAGSGMCNGGRIPHHLSVFLPDSRNQVLIIAYQANGSLGRRLRDGEKIVTIENQKIKVRAKVTAIGSYSSHADQPKLLYWLKQISKPKPKKVFIMHGEGKANLMLADGVVQKLRLNYLIPEYGKTYDL